MCRLRTVKAKVCIFMCLSKARVFQAGSLVREVLVEDMVLTTSGGTALLDPWEGM